LIAENAYETQGRFEGAEPFETVNFRQLGSAASVPDVPKDAPIMTY
jgi:hypothetical protein